MRPHVHLSGIRWNHLGRGNQFPNGREAGVKMDYLQTQFKEDEDYVFLTSAPEIKNKKNYG